MQRCRQTFVFAVLAVIIMTCPGTAEWWQYPKPGHIRISNVSGDQITIRVSKSHRLPSDYVPNGLVEIPSDVIRTKKSQRVKKELLEPLRRLSEAACKAGVSLSVVSAYRSYYQQAEVYALRLEQEGGDVAATDKFSARPGHSEHQLGTAVDFSSAEVNDAIVGAAFNQTRAAEWLRKNAENYGFLMSYPKGEEQATGYMHEGWHWRYWGDAKPRY